MRRRKEYASRKNDEEEEHVADSLLYDERCHLPRTIPAPDVVVRERAGAAAPPTPDLAANCAAGVGEKRPHDGADMDARPPPPAPSAS